jgi:FtsP/CotA-like multicopper oxidase with cupredoxin domain
MRPTFLPLSRRRVLVGSGVILGGFSLPAWAQTPSGSVPDGFRILTIRPAALALPAVGPSAVNWGYDGVVPGPTLRVRRGEDLRVRLVNGMDEPTTVHWHGVRLPNAMDGTPPLTQQPIQPGASFDYRFAPPDAGTFWYHAGPTQTARGLAGTLIVEESERVEVARDVALMFQAAAPTATAVTVNGVVGPDIAVKAGERVRLRFVNASGLALRIQIPSLRCWVMAIDGQPAEVFLAREGRLALAPGNRIDIFVDAALEPGGKAPILLHAGPAPTTLAQLVAEAPGSTGPLPDPKPLPSNRLPERMDFPRALRVNVPIDASTLATGAALSTKPLFSVRRGRTVTLALINRTDAAHTIHLHGHSARLLDRLDDGWKPFWLDTVLVEAMQTVRVAFVADNPGKWAIDVGAVDRDGSGMFGWFEVT